MKPSDLELKILQILWTGGPGTARQVLEKIDDGKARAYTTILTTLQIMERKEFVTRTREGMSDRWKARPREKSVLGGYWRAMIQQFCGGRPSVAVQHLLDAENIDADELAEIERVIREHKEKRK